jgi:hypothetical protein
LGSGEKKKESTAEGLQRIRVQTTDQYYTKFENPVVVVLQLLAGESRGKPEMMWE